MANQINDCKFNFYTNALAKRQAPNFNGVSQYGLVDIDLLPSYIVEVEFLATGGYGGSNRILLDGPDRDYLWFSDSSGNITFSNKYEAYLDDVQIFDNQTPPPSDGLIHTIKLITTDTAKITSVAVNAVTLNSAFCNFPIFNLKVNDGSVYNYPMDDGWANNPTMRNTGTGADGTFINMTEAAWIEIDA